MATIELNTQSHRLLESLSSLRARMQSVSNELKRTGQLAQSELLRQNMAELDKGLDEGNLLTLVSDYLLGMQHDHHLRAQENDMLRDELTYVHSRWSRAEVMLVEMQEERKATEFDRKMGSYDDTLKSELTFDARIDDWVFVQDSLMDDNDDEDNYYDDVFGTFFPPEMADESHDIDDAEMFADERLSLDSSEMSRTVDSSVRTQTAVRYFAQYLNEGRFEVAEPLCHAMIADLQDCEEDRKRDLAVALEILAMCDRSVGQYADAADCLKEALSIYEETLEPESPVIVATLNNLAMLYGQCDQYDQAEPLCERALNMRKRRSGQHRDVARQHHNMAIIQQQRRSYDSAISHYQKALDIYSSEPETEETLATSEKLKKRMASVLCQQNRYAEASELYKDILTPTRNRVKLVIRHRPIWEVAEEVERMSASKCKQSFESYDLKYDYRDWYECIKVYLPNAFGALKRLAFVYRKMNMHNAAKMLEHLVNITDRKKTQLKFPRAALTPKALRAASVRRVHSTKKSSDLMGSCEASSSASSTSSGSYTPRRI